MAGRNANQRSINQMRFGLFKKFIVVFLFSWQKSNLFGRNATNGFNNFKVEVLFFNS